MAKKKTDFRKGSQIEHYKHHYYGTGVVEEMTYTQTTTFKEVLALSLLDAWKVVENDILFIESVPVSIRESTRDLNNLLYPRFDFQNNFSVLSGTADRELKNVYYAQSANYLISAGLHQHYGIKGLVHRITEQDPKNEAYFNKVECKVGELRGAFAKKLPLYATTINELLKSTDKIGSQYIFQVPDKDYPDILFSLFASNAMPKSCTPLYKDNGSELTDPYYSINLTNSAISQFVKFCSDSGVHIDFAPDTADLASDLIGDAN